MPVLVNEKAYLERREGVITQLQALVDACGAETRAFTQEEQTQYETLMGELNGIDGMLKVADETRAVADWTPAAGQEDKEALEERAFADYVLGKSAELRTGEQNVTMSNNGAIIPTSIANKIIKAVYDLCPILSGATRYHIKGTLKVPVWGKSGTDSKHDIAVGYQQEFTELTADAGKFTSVDLDGYLVGALVLIGRSVENNSAFSVTSFIVSQMAEEIARWLEKELLTGSGTSAAQGALNTTTAMTTASSTAITADELIELQASIKQANQNRACWTMNPSTFTALKKLKDGNNRYLLQDDITGAFPYRLLGKPVYLSDNMPAMAAGNKAVLYGDYSGLSVNLRENISIQILREKYATQHAIGVVAWLEFDSRITDNAKLAALVMKAASGG